MSVLLELPIHIGPESQEWGLKSNTRIFTSKFTGVVQTQATPGSLWTCTYNYPLLRDDQMRVFKAFLLKLRGQANRFTARDFAYVGPISTITLTAIKGETTATISSAVVFTAGGYISIGNELKMIVESSTGTTITVEPPFRQNYTNEPTETNLPKTKMVLKEDSVNWNTVSPVISSLEFSGIEAI